MDTAIAPYPTPTTPCTDVGYLVVTVRSVSVRTNGGTDLVPVSVGHIDVPGRQPGAAHGAIAGRRRQGVITEQVPTPSGHSVPCDVVAALAAQMLREHQGEGA